MENDDRSFFNEDPLTVPVNSPNGTGYPDSDEATVGGGFDPEKDFEATVYLPRDRGERTVGANYSAGQRQEENDGPLPGDDSRWREHAEKQPERGADARPAYYPSSEESGRSTPPTPPAKKSKKWLIPVIAIIAIIAAAGALVPFLREQSRIKRYNEGADMYEKGDYQGAYEVFKELGNYEDSFDMATYAQRGIGYNNGLELMDKGEYSKAAETFDGLSGFKDSRALADQCRNEIAYQDAMALYQAGDLTGAREAFGKLSGFRDADSYAVRCGSELANIAYNKAVQEGDYARALEVLDSGEGQWENVEAMRTECQNHLLYLEASQDLANGLNYTAYKKFLSLEGFLDSLSRASTCKVSKPSNGEVYRNPKYTTKYLTLRITTPNDGNYNYLKIYYVGSTGAETLVVTVFIRPNKTVSITLPKGTYAFKCAYGSGAWFGEKEMFGDDAVYERLTPNGNNSYTFSKKGTYTLTLRSASNGNTGARSESRGTF